MECLFTASSSKEAVGPGKQQFSVRLAGMFSLGVLLSLTVLLSLPGSASLPGLPLCGLFFWSSVSEDRHSKNGTITIRFYFSLLC